VYASSEEKRKAPCTRPAGLWAGGPMALPPWQVKSLAARLVAPLIASLSILVDLRPASAPARPLSVPAR